MSNGQKSKKKYIFILLGLLVVAVTATVVILVFKKKDDSTPSKDPSTIRAVMKSTEKDKKALEVLEKEQKTKTGEEAARVQVKINKLRAQIEKKVQMIEASTKEIEPSELIPESTPELTPESTPELTPEEELSDVDKWLILSNDDRILKLPKLISTIFSHKPDLISLDYKLGIINSYVVKHQAELEDDVGKVCDFFSLFNTLGFRPLDGSAITEAEQKLISDLPKYQDEILAIKKAEFEKTEKIEKFVPFMNLMTVPEKMEYVALNHPETLDVFTDVAVHKYFRLLESIDNLNNNLNNLTIDADGRSDGPKESAFGVLRAACDASFDLLSSLVNVQYFRHRISDDYKKAMGVMVKATKDKKLSIKPEETQIETERRGYLGYSKKDINILISKGPGIKAFKTIQGLKEAQENISEFSSLNIEDESILSKLGGVVSRFKSVAAKAMSLGLIRWEDLNLKGYTQEELVYGSKKRLRYARYLQKSDKDK